MDRRVAAELSLRQETVEDLLVEQIGSNRAHHGPSAFSAARSIVRERSFSAQGPSCRACCTTATSSWAAAGQGRGGHRHQPRAGAPRLPHSPLQDRYSATNQRRTIDYSRIERQPGDDHPEPFSFLTDRITQPQVPCWITYTNAAVHDMVRANL